MVSFEDTEGLRVTISAWSQLYGQYAPALWGAGIRNTDEIANVHLEDLLPFVANNRIHAANMKEKAKNEGDFRVMHDLPAHLSLLSSNCFPSLPNPP